MVVSVRGETWFVGGFLPIPPVSSLPPGGLSTEILCHLYDVGLLVCMFLALVY